MNIKNNWNPHMNKDSIAFSALLIAGLAMAWFGAATSLADSNAMLARHDAATSDPRSTVTAAPLKTAASTRTKVKNCPA